MVQLHGHGIQPGIPDEIQTVDILHFRVQGGRIGVPQAAIGTLVNLRAAADGPQMPGQILLDLLIDLFAAAADDHVF